LHAQAKPPAYLITEIAVNNQDAFMKEFADPGMKPIQEQGGKFLARGSKPISLGGASVAPRVTVIQFPSMDKAEAWWNSPAMKELTPIGEKYATFRSYFVEGVSP
jgi:uncharacterized protein (DUF1330 family)